MSLAKATLSGIVITDPEKRFTPNNTGVANFTIQVNGSGKNEQPFPVVVTCWRNLADVAVNRIQKGTQVIVEGRLQIRQTEVQGDYPRRNYEIDASNLYLGQLETLSVSADFGSAAPRQAAAPQPVAAGAYAPPAQAAGMAQPASFSSAPVAPQSPGFSEEILTEDDIPF